MKLAPPEHKSKALFLGQCIQFDHVMLKQSSRGTILPYPTYVDEKKQELA
jgi:hypothetical protein